MSFEAVLESYSNPYPHSPKKTGIKAPTVFTGLPKLNPL